MKKIRDKNDFYFVWAVERNGLPEDLNSVIDAKLTLRAFNKNEALNFDIVDTNKIGVEFKKSILNEPGAYNLELSYTLPDSGFSDGIRTCTVDIDPFEIVPRSEQADDSSEFTVTSDVAVAFKGDKGDPFLYENFTEEQILTLQQPAITAAESIGQLQQSISESEALRVTAEQKRQTDTAAAIQAAIEAADLANSKAILANDAAGLAQEVAEHPDMVVSDYWHKWNTTLNVYENTGIKAKGDTGPMADVSMLVNESGELIATINN